MSSAELSIDISQLVRRALSGELIDPGSEGETLAARYPELGMSAELIGKAITRASAMMGVAVGAAEEAPADAPHAVPVVGNGSNTPSAFVKENASADPAPVSAGDLAENAEDLPVLNGPAGAASFDAPVAALRRAFFGG